MSEIKDLFSFFNPVKMIGSLAIHIDCDRFCDMYGVDKEDLKDEIKRLARILQSSKTCLNNSKSVLDFIVEWKLDESVPLLYSSLKLFLTIAVYVASCERSFSKLKLIKKNYLRTTMGQSRLSDLGLLSIECELAQNIDFESVIQDFSDVCTRKIKM